MSVERLRSLVRNLKQDCKILKTCNTVILLEKWSSPLRISSVNVVTFTEEILNGKLHFFVQCKYKKVQNKIIETVK